MYPDFISFRQEDLVSAGLHGSPSVGEPWHTDSRFGCEVSEGSEPGHPRDVYKEVLFHLLRCSYAQQN